MYMYRNYLHQPKHELLKDAFGKGYDKSDILNFLQNVKGILNNLFVSSQENLIALKQLLPHMIHRIFSLSRRERI